MARSPGSTKRRNTRWFGYRIFSTDVERSRYLGHGIRTRAIQSTNCSDSVQESSTVNVNILHKLAGRKAIYGLSTIGVVMLLAISCTERTGLSGAWEERQWTKGRWHFSMLEFHEDGMYTMRWAPAQEVECGTPLFQRGRIDTANDTLRIRSDFNFDTLRWHYNIVGDSLVLTGIGEMRVLHRTTPVEDDQQ